MSLQSWLEVGGDMLALAVALLGWWLHIRECRSTQDALREENRRLVEALSRAVEQNHNRSGGEWRRAP